MGRGVTTTKRGQLLLDALDAHREGVSKQRHVYTNQTYAMADALAYAYVFIVKPELAAIEAEAREQELERLRDALFTLATLDLPTGEYVDRDDVMEMLAPEPTP